MNRLLRLYNDNSYVKICVHVLSVFDKVDQLIDHIIRYRDYSKKESIKNILEDSFVYSEYANHFVFSTKRVVNPHYMKAFQEHELHKGNSTHHITLKIDDLELLSLDEIYGSQLSGMLRILKRMFTIIDAPDHKLSQEALEKRAEVIRSVKNKMTDFLESRYRKEEIDNKEKLERDIIRNIPFGGFFHLTHIDNLSEIVSEGLLSRNKLINSDKILVDISNSLIQKERERPETVHGKSIHDYVPLYINPKNPFLGSQKVQEELGNLVLLEIFPHILVQRKDTLFSDGNAAELETNFFGNKEELENINWSLLQQGEWKKGEDSKRIMCSEILIPDRIENVYIQKIRVNNESILPQAMKTFMNSAGIELDVDSDLFKLSI